MSKKPMTAPVIIAEGLDDYLLENGNTISKTVYDEMWKPKKTQLTPNAYKNVGGQIANELKNKRS